MKSALLSLTILFALSAIAYAQDGYVQLSDPIEETEAYRIFGSEFDENVPSATLEEMVATSEAYDTKEISTEGTIAQVCRKKGCFFILSSGDKQARITFKDYNFFIPSNTAGSRVRLNGTFHVKTLSEKQAKHYAEDAGEDPGAVQGPKREYSIVATSVVIYK